MKKKEQEVDMLEYEDEDGAKKIKLMTMEESKIMRAEAGESKTIFGKPTIIIKVSNKKIEKQEKKRNKKQQRKKIKSD